MCRSAWSSGHYVAMDAGRSDWLLGVGPSPIVHRSWPVVVRTLWPRLASAWTDLYPAPDWEQWNEVPEEARLARAALLALEPLGKKNRGAAVDVPLSEAGLRLLSAWGSYSIHTELAHQDGTIVLVAHDEGWLSARLTEPEVEAVRSALAAEGLALEWLVPEQKPSWWRWAFGRS